jgi:hypothetical protein
VHSNLLPHREPVAVAGQQRTIELPAVSVEVAEGEQLFLLVTPVAEMFGAHTSRVPGVMTLDAASVRVPLLAAAAPAQAAGGGSGQPGGQTGQGPAATPTGSTTQVRAAPARQLAATGLDAAPALGLLALAAATGAALVRRRGAVDDRS